MTKFKVIIAAIICQAISASAQWSSPYNSSGNVKSVSERSYDNYKSNERKAENDRYKRAASTEERARSTNPGRPASTTTYTPPASVPATAPAKPAPRVGYSSVYNADGTVKHGWDNAAPAAPSDYSKDQVGEVDVQGNRIVKVNKKQGVIDQNDKVLIPVIYDWIVRFSEGYYRVSLDNEKKNIYLK
jgi:hypothetical protein